MAHAREVFVPSQHHRDLQDKQCQLSQMHLVESVGSDQRDGLTERAMGVLLGSSGTQPACFLRVFLGEQRRNRHGGEFLHEGDYHDDPKSLCGNADACAAVALGPSLVYWSYE